MLPFLFYTEQHLNIYIKFPDNRKARKKKLKGKLITAVKKYLLQTMPSLQLKLKEIFQTDCK